MTDMKFRSRKWTVYLLYALSGGLSLSYQVVWFRIFIDRFGSTNLTFILVLCCFIGGLGLGALLSRNVQQWLTQCTRVEDPLRLYGLLELGIAAAVLLTFGLRVVPANLWGVFPYQLDSDGIYVQTFVYQWSKLGFGSLCVLIPCFLMGTTFPLLCHVYRADTRFPSALYGWNTFGACTAILVSEFVLLPMIGHEHTLIWLVGTNFALGLFFVVVGAGNRDEQPYEASETDAVSSPTERPNDFDSSLKTHAGVVHGSATWLLICASVGGLLTGAVEGDMFKRLWFLGCESHAGMSFISFWAILGIFLASWTVRALPRLRFGHI